MRVAFCGSGTFAIPSLKAILRSDHDVVLVVTQPPRPAGRGGKVHPTPIGLLARQEGLDPLASPDVNSDDTVSTVAEARPEAICVVEFGQFVRQPFRSTASVDSFNLHASLLPELRGAAPVNWALIRGYERTGVTTFSLTDRMDDGPVYLQDAMAIEPDDTAESLRSRLAEAGAEVVVRTLNLLRDGGAEPTRQDHSRATEAPRLKKSDGRICWADPAGAIRDRIRGTFPWPGAQTALRRKNRPAVPVILGSVAVAEGPAAGAAGRIDHDLLVATGDGRLGIEAIKPAGKRMMDWRDFVNGYRVGPGDGFGMEEN